ncbi:hypothetical protein [Kiloniella sp.]|uniref:hypothetical protein n=1 Tax=Kiloniella sp. TaxID=1938587 RepID=UPI003B01DA98
MRLIGSRREVKLREELVAGHQHLFANADKKDKSIRSLFKKLFVNMSKEQKEDKRILSCLRSNYPNMVTAYCLHWIPEQGEDIYFYLVDLDNVAVIEIDRLDDRVEIIFENMTLRAYRKELSKSGRLLLAVALDLAQKDIDNNKHVQCIEHMQK